MKRLTQYPDGSGSPWSEEAQIVLANIMENNRLHRLHVS